MNRGAVVAERTVSVAPSTGRTVQIRYRVTDPGTYALAVDGVPVGTVTVREPPAEPATPAETATPDSTGDSGETTTTTASPTPHPDTSTGTATPVSGPTTPTTGDGTGFGVLVALIALGLVALLGRRRH